MIPYNLSVSWPEEPIPVEVNQVIRHVGEPDLGFPRDVFRMLFEFPHVRKRAQIDEASLAFAEHDFELDDPLR